MQVTAVCMVILFYKARVTNSLLGNIVTWKLDCSAAFREGVWGSLPGPCTSGLPRLYTV